MNKIYKLVWSKTKNMYVAVCEFARSHTKASKSGNFRKRLVDGGLIAILSCGFASQSFAAITSISVPTGSEMTVTASEDGFYIIDAAVFDGGGTGTDSLDWWINGKWVGGYGSTDASTVTIPVKLGDELRILSGNHNNIGNGRLADNLRHLNFAPFYTTPPDNGNYVNLNCKIS